MAKTGDGEAFRDLVAPYRRELQVTLPAEWRGSTHTRNARPWS
ncbi:hypothetical protein [Amycolatopsis sp. lyj-108]